MGALPGGWDESCGRRSRGAMFMAEQKLRPSDDIPAGHITGIWDRKTRWSIRLPVPGEYGAM